MVTVSFISLHTHIYCYFIPDTVFSKIALVRLISKCKYVSWWDSGGSFWLSFSSQKMTEVFVSSFQLIKNKKNLIHPGLSLCDLQHFHLEEITKIFFSPRLTRRLYKSRPSLSGLVAMRAVLVLVSVVCVCLSATASLPPRDGCSDQHLRYFLGSYLG